MTLTQQQIDIYNGKVCPYCKKPSKWVDSSEVYPHVMKVQKMYVCFDCKAWVGTHTDRPHVALGRLAQKNLRERKIAVHYYFDQLWKEKAISRREAYTWLAEQLGIPVEYTHIGWFNLETCDRVLKIVSPVTFVRPTKLDIPKRTKKPKSKIKNDAKKHNSENHQ